MNSFLRIIFLLFLLSNVSGISAQQGGSGKGEVYGSDPLLYNGKFYTFFPPLNTGGDQYFTDRQFESGSVTLRGVTFSGVMLNYDIYNQQLILKCKNTLGSTNMIIVSDAWLEKFSLRGMNFEMITIQDTVKRIFQVLGTGRYRILYYWEKKLSLDTFYGAKNHNFSPPRKEMNLFNGSQIFKYWNNKSFCLTFDTEKRTVVREYLNRHKINVKNANNQSMAELISYCNSVYLK